ncbi:MAG: hypothetical protein V3W18_14890 [candidate division Zixibacteria bacterium]
MPKRVKKMKKELNVKRGDIESDKELVEKLANISDERQKRFKSKIETARKEALEGYKNRIYALKERKTETVKKYDEEIKKYEVLVKSFKTNSNAAKSDKAKKKKK